MTVPHHSEPAREAVAVPAGWKLVPIEPTRAMKDAVSRKVDDFAREHARLFVSEIWQDMLSASPAATSAPTYVVNCCNCGRIIDTREESEGGDQWGHELSDDRWVCSPECLDAVTDPDATSAATRGEADCTDCGGSGVTYQTERRCSCQPPPAPAVSAQVKEALDVAREYVVDGLSAQDQKRRDVEGYPGLMKREQGRLDEVRADLALVDHIRASLDLATDAEG